MPTFQLEGERLAQFRESMIRTLLAERLSCARMRNLDFTGLDSQITAIFQEIGVICSDNSALIDMAYDMLKLDRPTFMGLPETSIRLHFDADLVLKQWIEEDSALLVLKEDCFNDRGEIDNPIYEVIRGRPLAKHWGYLCLYNAEPCYVHLAKQSTDWQVKVRCSRGDQFLREFEERMSRFFLAEHQGKAVDYLLRPVELKEYDRDQLVYPEKLGAQIDEMMTCFKNWFTSKLVTRWGYILVGRPGTGKTTIGGLLAKNRPTGCTFLYCPASELLASHQLRSAFRVAETLSPTIMQIDDVDLIARNRSYDGTGMTSELMEQLDGLQSGAKIFILLTTNDPRNIDPAIARRAGRVSGKIVFDGFRDCISQLLALGANKFSLQMDRETIDEGVSQIPQEITLTPDEAINVCKRLHLVCGNDAITAERLRQTIMDVYQAFEVADLTNYLDPDSDPDEDD